MSEEKIEQLLNAACLYSENYQKIELIDEEKPLLVLLSHRKTLVICQEDADTVRIPVGELPKWNRWLKNLNKRPMPSFERRLPFSGTLKLTQHEKGWEFGSSKSPIKGENLNRFVETVLGL